MAITLNGNSNVSLLYSSGGRITGDFTNATLLSRAMFQTSTADSTTGIYALPSGTSTAASWQATNNADPTNASKVLIATNGTTDCQLVSGRNGSGTYLPLSFYTNGSQQMQLDTSGNLGLGVTPNSGWDTGTSSKFFQFGRSGAIGYDTSNAWAALYGNAYQTGLNGFKYLNSGYAGLYAYCDYNGSHIWYNAASGTANTTFTPTQAMTLDASGNLTLGGTAANGRFTVYPATTPTTTAGANQIWIGESSFNASYRLQLGYANYSGVFKGTIQAYAAGVTTDLVVCGDGGNLLVGTTTVGQSNSNSLTLQPSGGIGVVNHASGTTSGTGYFAFAYNGTGIGSISQQSTTSVNFNGNSVPPSDIRLKENLSAAPDALPVIDKLQVKSFDWKSEGGHQTYGVIAQEVLEIFPEFVSVPPNPDEMLGINQSAMVPFLVKAIQELTARLEALEGAK